jgi:hypothetical protein
MGMRNGGRVKLELDPGFAREAKKRAVVRAGA